MQLQNQEHAHYIELVSGCTSILSGCDSDNQIAE